MKPVGDADVKFVQVVVDIRIGDQHDRVVKLGVGFRMGGTRGRRRQMRLGAEDDNGLVRVPQIISNHLRVFENGIEFGRPGCGMMCSLGRRLGAGCGSRFRSDIEVGSQLFLRQNDHLLAFFRLLVFEPFEGEGARLRAGSIRDGRDGLKMILIGTPLSEVLTSVTRLIETQRPGMLCSIFLLDVAGVHLRYAAAPSLPESYRAATDGLARGPNAGSCGTAVYAVLLTWRFRLLANRLQSP